MSFDPNDQVQLEAFLRDQITRKRERDKLDFKQAWLNDLPDKRKPEIDQRAKMELIKDINAMANTFSLDFEDYGFLVLGVSRNEGAITMDVPSLRNPGVDNLEASIAEWLAEYMEPQPEFFLAAFKEPEVGTWGALVLRPNQSPPFVFSKDGTYKQKSGASDQLWREGEWRLRRNARTVKPRPLDYTQMLRTRIQSALDPLQREVLDLRQQVSRLGGQIEGLQQSAAQPPQTELDATLLFSGQPVTDVQFRTGRQAGEAVLAGQRDQINELLNKVAQRSATEQKELPWQLRTDMGYYDLVAPFDSYIRNPPPGHPRSWPLDELLPFMEEWGFAPESEHQQFPYAGYYQPNRRGSRQDMALLGPDAEAAKAYLSLLRLARQTMPEVKLAASQAPFLEFNLRIHNVSGVSTGNIRLELRCTEGAGLYQFSPGRQGSGSRLVGHGSQDYERPLPVFQESRLALLPGDTWTSEVFALKFSEDAEAVTLHLKVWAANLPEPKEVKLTLNAKPAPPAS